MKKTVTLTFSDGSPSIELPIEEGTYGKPVIDIRALGAHGYFTHDPGFTATSITVGGTSYTTSWSNGSRTGVNRWPFASRQQLPSSRYEVPALCGDSGNS